MKNFRLIEEFLIHFLQQELYKTGLKNAILGLSGGIDSAVVAVLAQKAFGKNFHALTLPSNASSQSSFDDAKELCDKFNINYSNVYIGDLIQNYFQDQKASNLRIGNFAARMRMSVLYDRSAELSALVLGTSNKSELLLGYGTMFGDLASAINPIGDLYKSDIFAFAKYLEIPQRIIKKPPSADLWEGQNDEDDLGYPYSVIDKALSALVDDRLSEAEMLEAGYEAELIKLITNRMYKNQFKRKMPVIAKLSERTIGHDFLYPRDIKM